jgi:D-3-phosphoglycerate dehydrogenase
MPKHKIVFTDYYYPNNDKELEILNRLGDVEIVDCTKIVSGGVKEEEKVIPLVADADGIIVQFASISKNVIDHLKNCKIISRYAIGVDVIDVKAAKEKGIVVANVPDYCVEEVSDTAIAHMFNCLRKVSLADHLLRKNEWAYEQIRPMRRISGLTVGLVAFGRIARRVAEKLRVFNLKVLACDPYFEEKDKYPWVRFLPLKDMLGQSDIVSIHAPLIEATYHLLDKEAFGWMKEGVILVNTSRGGLIAENALIEAIDTNKVSMAGLDVLECQDTEYDQSALLKYPERVVITPHMGWYSEEAIADLQTKTALNVYEMLRNGKPLYSV